MIDSEANVSKASPKINTQTIGRLMGQFWAWLFLLILVAFFSLTGKGFFSLFNFQSILANASIILIIALGQTFVILTGGIDLSLGYLMGLVSVVAVAVMTAAATVMPVPAAVVLGCVAGLAIGVIPGFVNGRFISKLKVPAFIMTLGMQGIVRGIGFVICGGLPLPLLIKNIGIVGNGYLFYHYAKTGAITFIYPPAGVQGVEMRQVAGFFPFPVILSLSLVVILHLILSKTQFGLRTYAVGGNQEASSRAGIPVDNHITKLYMISALMASIAGLLYAFRFTNGAANAGEALVMDSVAAVVIGGASLFGGEGTIVGTLIGALIIAVITNGFVILGVNAFWQYVAVGVVIIVAVLADQAKGSLVK